MRVDHVTQVRLTSLSGINAGPEAISVALVPGRILRVAALSKIVESSVSSCAIPWLALIPGD